MLAVTTGLPARKAASMNSWAGCRPPMSSTTTSTSSRTANAAPSVTNSSPGMEAGRARVASDTAMPTSSRWIPVRAAMSSWRVRRSAASALPTFPQPKSATLTEETASRSTAWEVIRQT